MDDTIPDGAADGRPAVSLDTPIPSPESPPASNPGRPVCACGHDRSHYLVSPVPTYSGWAKFWVIFMGVSTKASRIDFQCRQCRQVFDFTDDTHELGQYL